MRKALRIAIIYVLMAMIYFGCKDPYLPPSIIHHTNFLVVEGTINAGGMTMIKLTRTRNLTDTSNGGINIEPIYESGAQVTVEDDAGNSLMLPEITRGTYGANILHLDDSRKYHLNIHTQNGETYESFPTPVIHTVPIDSITWKLNQDGIELYVNTHNTNEKNGYYRWEYEETWEIHSSYRSYLEYVQPNVIPRSPEHAHIYTCWQSEKSARIILGATVGLSQNIISQTPVAVIPDHAEKASVLYSILVRQYALSREEFEFWQTMKKNTEETGSIFEPLPSNLRGNIRCVSDPSKPAIGYVAINSPAEKRLFISNDELPGNWNTSNNCELQFIIADSSFVFGWPNGPVPVQEAIRDDGSDGYLASDAACVDCTLRGTNIKPAFWP